MKPNGDAGLRVITLGLGNPIFAFLYVRAYVRRVCASWYPVCVRCTYWAKGLLKICPRGRPESLY